ncbi:MAG: endonuclease V [Anaerolineae bacterium]|nr:endonuclease V [Anaerolineae bacterium]
MAVALVFPVHSWDVSLLEARGLQQRLRARVRIEPLPASICVVGGVDASFAAGMARAAAVLFSFPDLEPLEAVTAEAPLRFPYLPGLLAFREGPAVLAALAKLKRQADVLLFDAHGLAHPRRMGLAAHIGVLLDRPSVGCAKSRLCGEHPELSSERGSWVELTEDGEVIGACVRTRTGVRPLYVSVGHRADLETAVRVTLACCHGCRLPEPTRWAHRVAGGEPLPSSWLGGR